MMAEHTPGSPLLSTRIDLRPAIGGYASVTVGPAGGRERLAGVYLPPAGPGAGPGPWFERFCLVPRGPSRPAPAPPEDR